MIFCFQCIARLCRARKKRKFVSLSFGTKQEKGAEKSLLVRTQLCCKFRHNHFNHLCRCQPRFLQLIFRIKCKNRPANPD